MKLLKLPDCYKLFLSDVCKNSPVAGYVQVTRNKPLIILKQFCTNQLDIRNGHHQNELIEVKSQLPALWKQLSDICQFRNTNFLPLDVSAIVLVLLKVKNQTSDIQNCRTKIPG